MRAVVLVGGEGTRLRPLTWTTPKQMLPVAEVPMIERVLAHLALHGVDEAVLSLGYRPDAFITAFPDGRCAGVKLTYAVEPEPLDTAGAIRFAAHHAGVTERFLAVNGDVLTDLDIGALVEFHEDRGAEATIHLTHVDDPARFGVVPTDDEGRVVAFVEKPAPGEAPSHNINAGTYLLETSVLDRIPAGRRVSIERETFPALVQARRLYARPDTSYWIDAGTPAQYLQAQLDLITGARSGPPAPGAVERDPGVWTLGAAVIDGSVSPPALIGDASYVEAGAQVERSIVGAGARVHDGAWVRSSVLLPGAVVRPGAVVERSVVGELAVVGERARLLGGSVLAGRATVAPDAELEGAKVEAGAPR
jgi:NDP-sugar pyrophosphorylase family protein